MKGDKIQVLVDTGEGTPRVFEMTATQGGRRVEVVVDGPLVTIREVKRTGKPVRSMRFPTERIVALIEQPIGSAKDQQPTLSSAEKCPGTAVAQADGQPALPARSPSVPAPAGGNRPSGGRPATASQRTPSRGRSTAGRSKKGRR